MQIQISIFELSIYDGRKKHGNKLSEMFAILMKTRQFQLPYQSGKMPIAFPRETVECDFCVVSILE